MSSCRADGVRGAASRRCPAQDGDGPGACRGTVSPYSLARWHWLLSMKYVDQRISSFVAFFRVTFCWQRWI